MRVKMEPLNGATKQPSTNLLSGYLVEIKMSTKKLLFVIRKNGLRDDIVQKAMYELNHSGFRILKWYLVVVRDKKKIISLPLNKKPHFRDVEEFLSWASESHNACLAFELEDCEIDQVKLKYKLRDYYLDEFPLKRNVFHCSSNPRDAKSEIKRLRDRRTRHFRGVGSYYKRREI